MSLVSISQSNGLFLLLLNNGQDNWFTHEFIRQVSQALDDVLSKVTPHSALVTMATNSKIYSNGLNLKEAVEIGQPYFDNYMKLLYKLLTFPIPTIAGAFTHRLMIL